VSTGSSTHAIQRGARAISALASAQIASPRPRPRQSSPVRDASHLVSSRGTTGAARRIHDAFSRQYFYLHQTRPMEAAQTADE